VSNLWNVTVRWLTATFVMGWSVVAAGQLSGQFYLEKSRFAPGEPIFLYFEVVNDGPHSENIHSADPYSFCSGYHIDVSSDPKPTSSCPALVVGGSCLSSSVMLPSGKSRIERLLLNFDHEIDVPGPYSVEAERYLSHAPATANYFSPDTPKDTLEVRTTLYFEVDPSTTEDPKALQTFLGALKSNDPIQQSEAARTLASIAPKSLEDALLGFADSNEFRQFAPLAFHRLNTQRSIKALADLLEKSEAGSYEHMKSAGYLAESGDPQWFPLLRDVAQKHAQIGNYVYDAAELGGDKMLPTLVSLLGSPDKEFTRINAVTAMGYTGSRTAVPILLDLLRSPDTDIADRARYALRVLTHRTASDDQNESPQSQSPKWSQWWARGGTSAPIYKATECGNFIPLQ
jgi:HEAT repeats